jgi:stearoyl-CoA desaturase (delta-9 desaturase)
MEHSVLLEKRPWAQPWWKPHPQNRMDFFYFVLIHTLAVVGLVLFPLPGWKVLLGALVLTACGGLGTTVGFHRGLAHRAVKLNPVVEQILILFAVFNGSGSPRTWIANHRNHHANSDTIDDVSSPRHGGFWWAHLRWLYQWEASDMGKWCPDMIRPRYMFWTKAQPYLLIASLTFGYFLFGWPGFFWLGAIRLVYCLHMQAFVNSLLHLKPGLPEGVDSSQNIWWLGPLQVTAWGENWHGNHHAYPASACFSRHWWQVDIGWYFIRGLEQIGLATNVRTHRSSFE